MTPVIAKGTHVVERGNARVVIEAPADLTLERFAEAMRGIVEGAQECETISTRPASAT